MGLSGLLAVAFFKNEFTFYFFFLKYYYKGDENDEREKVEN